MTHVRRNDSPMQKNNFLTLLEIFQAPDLVFVCYVYMQFVRPNFICFLFA